MRSLLLSGCRSRWSSFLLLAALLTLGLTLPAAATHLLGGEARYRYLDAAGTTPGRPFRYEITFSIYYNCEIGGQNGSNFPCGRSLIGVSIYDKSTGLRIDDVDNPSNLVVPNVCPSIPMPGNSNAPANTYPFFRASDSTITSPPPPGCTITAGCALVVNYTAIVELPFAATGYYAVYGEAARNNSVTNLAIGGGGQQNQPQVLQLEIARPVSSYANTSPVFSDVPVPLVCSGDTVTLINNAFDAEGDRLLYSFYTPFQEPAPPGSTYVVPTPVDYAAGYSVAQPFGAGGYAQIDPLTGETQYLIPNQGDYVVGVRVSEFRTINGTDRLLSTIEREIQLKVRQCPNNTPPSLQFASGQTTLTIEEGATGTFTTNASVAAGNSLTLLATSPLLDGSGGYNATFNGQLGPAVEVNGTTALVGNFVYASACGDAGVYNVNVTARDNDGCPIKSTSIPFLLTVRRPAPATGITGDVTVCPNTTASYTAIGAPATTTAYQWTVVGGTVQGPATGATVNILWTAVGTQSLSVAAVSSFGCLSDTLSVSVEVFAGVTATLSGLNAAYCVNPTAAGTTLIGSPAGGTFSITGAGGTTNLVGNVFTPRVAGTFQVTYTFNDPNGCIAISTPFAVTVNPLPVVALAASLPATICSNDSSILLTGTVDNTPATTGFTIDGTDATVFDPAVLPAGPHVVALAGTNAAGCADTATFTVTVNAAPVVVLAGLQASYCANAPIVTLTATANGDTLTSANAAFTIDGAVATQINPATLTAGIHTVRVQGTGANGCRDTDSAQVEIRALPVLAITGLDAAYCRDATPVTLAGTVDSAAGGTFTIDGTAATAFNPAALSVGPHTVVFSGTGVNACSDSLSRIVTVNPLPVVAIVAPTATSFCLNAPTVTLTGNAPGQFTIDANPTVVTSFLPANLGVGPHVIRFTRTEVATGCTNDTTLAITVLPLPALAITSTLQAAYCADEPAVTLTGTVDTAPGGTFTIDNVAATTLNPATLTPGVHTIIFSGTGTNTCTTSDTAVVTINALPTVTLTPLNAAYCASAPAIPLTATVGGGVGTATITIDNNATTSLDPAALTPGSHTVMAIGIITATGCRDTVSQVVTINALPTVAITGLNANYCQGDPAVTLAGTVTNNGTVTFTVNAATATTFDPTTLAPGTYTVVATGIDSSSCQNTATQTVTLNPRPTAVVPTGPPSVCPGLTGVPYSVTGAPGQTFEWTVVGGSVAGGQGTASILVDWGPANPAAGLTVVTIDPGTTCRSLPATMPVTVNQVLATQTPAGTASFCVNAGSQTFSIPVPSPGSTYNWAFTGASSTGAVITGQGTASITVTFVQPGSASLIVTETSSTPLSNCFGTSAPLSVTVLASPDTTLAVQSSAPAACATGGPVTFTLPGATGSTYQWTVDGVAQPGITGGTFTYTAATAGTFIIGAQETNQSGCIGPVLNTTFTVNPVPTAATITGSATICPQGLTGQTYSVTGLPGSAFQWTITGGTITAGQGTASVTVDFDGTTVPTLSVTETSSAGCAGPASPIALTFDAAAPDLTLASVDETLPANQIDLNLSGLNAQPGTTLVIQRRVSGSGSFQQVGTVAAPANTFADTSVDPNATAYDYRVDLTNACGTLLQSAEHTTIRVQATGTEASGDVTLTWNEYRGQPVRSYEVLRKNASGGYDVLGTTPTGTLTYTATGVGREGFNQTFRIRASVGSGPIALASTYSNEAQVTFENKVDAYNVITPDGDGKNDRFVVENATLYPTNELVVFNRWGREVYRRKNYDNSWNGEGLSAGTYLYLFTANGQTIKNWVEIVK